MAMEEVSELAPGDNAVMIPDRWCPECETPRPKAKCSLCGTKTVEPTEEQIEAEGMGKRRDVPAPAVREVEQPADMDTELEELRRANAAQAERIAELEGETSAGLEALEAEGDARVASEDERRPVSGAELRATDRAADQALAQVRGREGWAGPPPPWSSPPQTGERAANPPRREGTQMRNGQQQETDDMGRRVVVMGGRNNGQPESSTAGEVLRRMWKNDQIDRALWCSMAGHAIVGTAGDAQKAAEAADALYFEMWERIHQDS